MISVGLSSSFLAPSFIISCGTHQVCFHFGYCIFKFWNFRFVILYIFYFFAEAFSLFTLFKSFHLYLENFVIATLKYLSEFQCLCPFGIDICWLFYSSKFRVSWFFVFWEFRIVCWAFRIFCYVIQGLVYTLWIILIFWCVLAGNQPGWIQASSSDQFYVGCSSSCS